MGYMHIESLYRCPEFFQLFEQVLCLEKIHGTSTWIRFERGGLITFHSGGENSTNFKALFDADFLTFELDKICQENNWSLIRIHGEGYGGKQQKMSKTYGSELKFIAFDVFVQENNAENSTRFLDVPAAEKLVQDLGLEFVDYVQGPNLPEWIEEQSNRPSVQAVRNGILEPRPREGVVVRPLTESQMPKGSRAIFKHKNQDFWEIRTRRPLGEKIKIAEKVSEIISDWVTEQRFSHVTDRVLQNKTDKNVVRRDISSFLDLMVEDVKRESEGEVVWSEILVKEIRKETARLFKISFPNLKMQ